MSSGGSRSGRVGAPTNSSTSRPSTSAPTSRNYTDGPARGEAVAPPRGGTSSGRRSNTGPSSSRSEPIPGADSTRGSVDTSRSRITNTAPRFRSSLRPAGTVDQTGRQVSPSVGRTTRARSRSTSSEQARAREQLAQRSARSRARTITRADILQRYRGATPSRDTSDSRRSTDSRNAGTAARISAARNAATSNAQRAQAVRSAREQTRIDNARGDYLNAVNQRRAARARNAQVSGNRSSNISSLGYTGGYNDNPVTGFHDSFHAGIGSNYWGFWGNNFHWFWGPSFYYSSYWWHSYWYYGGSFFGGFAPSYYYYGPSLPASSTIIYVGDQGTANGNEVAYDETVNNVDPAPAVEESTAANLSRAADYYLSLGDRAFRESRFGDAVHYYAQAVEHSPEEGVLFLILSDALFATGDYHYAAYSLRRALELDPELVNNVVDKHSFYAEAGVFDRQLEVLERYLKDHFLDEDARLVLAANYLFGNQSIECIKLLQGAYGKDVAASPAGTLLLNAAIADLAAASDLPTETPDK